MPLPLVKLTRAGMSDRRPSSPRTDGTEDPTSPVDHGNRAICSQCQNHTPLTLLRGICPIPDVKSESGASKRGRGRDPWQETPPKVLPRCACSAREYSMGSVGLAAFGHARERGCPLCSLVSRAIRAYSDKFLVESTGPGRQFSVHIFDDRVYISSAAIESSDEDVHLCIRPRYPWSSFWCDRSGPDTFHHGLWPALTHYDSPEPYDWIKRSIAQCLTQHKSVQCRASSHAALPTRIVDVGSPSSEPKVTLGEGIVAPYIALSHCWGGEPAVKLTRKSLLDMSNGIEALSLPQTFQDAIIVARRLDIHYLWIDALCILQDDAEDWAREAAGMGAVFANAQFVLSATLAHSDRDGFLRQSSKKWPLRYVRGEEDLSRRPPQYVEAANETNVLDTVVQRAETSNPPYNRPIETFPTSRRAWCFQEQLLGRRILSFEKGGLTYHCSEDPALNRYERSLVDNGLEATRKILAQEWRDGLRLSMRDWDVIVGAYTRRDLKVPSDRLPALSAIAKHIVEKQGVGPGESSYLGGLWSSHLPWNLLWTTDARSGWNSAVALQKSPSFSWCSVKGAINKNRTGWDTWERLVEVQEARCYAKGPDPYGHVAWGFIRLVGSVYVADLSGFTAAAPPGEPFSHPSYKVTGISDLFADGQPGTVWPPPQSQYGTFHEDVGLVVGIHATKSGGRLSYLSRKQAKSDCGDGAMCARATLLLFAQGKERETYAALKFLVLGPVDRPQGCDFVEQPMGRYGR
ncbi:hypothetical protein LTR53_015774 [Teratosphaeriaceae sp. CCFEE 6253]|nr:hypothetical protein LTR53_015774 [Teratosphaeriaceae sp. CCFEE 6253]